MRSETFTEGWALESRLHIWGDGRGRLSCISRCTVLTPARTQSPSQLPRPGSRCTSASRRGMQEPAGAGQGETGRRQRSPLTMLHPWPPRPLDWQLSLLLLFPLGYVLSQEAPRFFFKQDSSRRLPSIFQIHLDVYDPSWGSTLHVPAPETYVRAPWRFLAPECSSTKGIPWFLTEANANPLQRRAFLRPFCMSV